MIKQNIGPMSKANTF